MTMTTGVGGALPTTRSLRTNRTYQLITAGQAVSVLGDAFHSIALGLWVLQVTGSTAAMGTIYGARILTTILLSPIAGTLADRVDRRRLMWSLDLVRGLISLAMALAMITAGVPFVVLVLLAALLTAATSFRSPAYSASIIHIVGREQIQQATSTMQLINSGANILGPILGGVAIGLFGGVIALVVDGLSFFISAGCVLLGGPFPSPTRAVGERPSFVGEMMEGFRYIRQSPVVMAITWLNTVGNFFGNMYAVLFPVLAIKVWQASPGQFGFAEAMFSLGITLGALAVRLLGKRLRQRGLWAAATTGLMGLAMLSIALVPGPLFANPLIVMLGALLSFSGTLMAIALRAEVAPEMQGRVWGTLGALLQIASPVAVLVASTLGDSLGVTRLIVGAGVCFMLTGFLGLSFRALRQYA